jgi:hypothetical protein
MVDCRHIFAPMELIVVVVVVVVLSSSIVIAGVIVSFHLGLLLLYDIRLYKYNASLAPL